MEARLHFDDSPRRRSRTELLRYAIQRCVRGGETPLRIVTCFGDSEAYAATVDLQGWIEGEGWTLPRVGFVPQAPTGVTLLVPCRHEVPEVLDRLIGVLAHFEWTQAPRVLQGSGRVPCLIIGPRD